MVIPRDRISKELIMSSFFEKTIQIDPHPRRTGGGEEPKPREDPPPAIRR